MNITQKHLSFADLFADRTRNNRHTLIKRISAFQNAGAARLGLDGDYFGAETIKDFGTVSKVGAHVEDERAWGNEIRIEAFPPFIFRGPLPNVLDVPILPVFEDYGLGDYFLDLLIHVKYTRLNIDWEIRFTLHPRRLHDKEPERSRVIVKNNHHGIERDKSK